MSSFEGDGGNDEMMKQGVMKKKISACLFGAALAVMLVPGTVAQADPAPDQSDQEFTQFVQSHGVNLGGVSQTGNIARTLCSDLNNGYSQKDEVTQLTDSSKLNQQQAEFFVGAATANYCPNKHPASPPRGDG
jgi:Protein of unknown function (DUF732)